MKILKVIIAVLVVVVIIVAVRNKVLVDRFARENNLLKNENVRLRQNAKEIEKALIDSRSASMLHLGKTISMDSVEKIFPTGQTSPAPFRKSKLLLIFSELGCNVCQDEETRFAAGIASQYSPEHVSAVVHANNRRYVQNYIRLNRINFPVYFCDDEEFFKANKIKNTPMIFLLDKENKVIASHFPLPGHPQYSEPMHRFCYEYFNREGD